jgi:hypothetical protein
MQRRQKRFTAARPSTLRHYLGARVRVIAAGEFFGHEAEVTGYTVSKAPAYRLRFFDHPWQAQSPDARWSFTEREIESAE